MNFLHPQNMELSVMAQTSQFKYFSVIIPPLATFWILTYLLLFEDKGDTVDTESGIQEEDFFIQDEIYKSRLASIKRVSQPLMHDLYFQGCHIHFIVKDGENYSVS